MSKYIFLKLELQDGGVEHTSRTVLEVLDGQTVDEVAKEYLKGFWGDSEPYNPDDPRDESVEYPNGVVGAIESYYEIPKEDYDVLKKYI